MGGVALGSPFLFIWYCQNIPYISNMKIYVCLNKDCKKKSKRVKEDTCTECGKKTKHIGESTNLKNFA